MSTAAAFFALFGAGVASFLAPCVLPLVPAYLGMVAGEVSDGRSSTRGALLFVSGFTVVFVALGAAAGRLGDVLEDAGGILQRLGGALIVVFGLALVASTRTRFGGTWRLVRAIPTTGSVARPVVLGVAFGAAWTPCVGPFLGAALVSASQSGSPARGAVLLAAYSVGVGIPFIAASLLLGAWPTLVAPLRRLGQRLVFVSAGVLIALGLLLVTGAYPFFVDQLARYAPGAA